MWNYWKHKWIMINFPEVHKHSAPMHLGSTRNTEASVSKTLAEVREALRLKGTEDNLLTQQGVALEMHASCTRLLLC